MSAPVRDPRLAAIRQRLEAATLGPWHTYHATVQTYVRAHSGEYVMNSNGPRGYVQREQDAEFIAACREDIPWLLARVEALETEHERPGPSDHAGMNAVGSEKAEVFASEACSVFTPSQHGNAKPSTGAFVRCVRCKKPQHQHWLRQALAPRPLAPPPEGTP